MGDEVIRNTDREQSRSQANAESSEPISSFSMVPPSYTSIAGDDNTETTNSSSMIDDSSVNVDSVQIGGRRNIRNDSNVRDADDNPLLSTQSTVSGNASINTEGQIGGQIGYSQEETIGDATTSRSVSASGFVDLNENLEFEGLGGNVSVGRGNTTVTVGGGYSVKAEEPRPEGNRYFVSWSRSYSGSVGGSTSRPNMGGTGTRGTVGASGSVSSGVAGKRYFDTRALAQQFYDGRTWVNIDPSNAAELGVGDQISTSDSASLGASGSASLNGVSVGASLSVGARHTVQITGLGNNRVSVKIMDASILGASVSASASFISMGLSVESIASNGVIVNFDLSNPEGANSFHYLRTIGTLSPNGGYNMRATISAEQDTETTSIGLAGATLTRGSRTSRERTDFADGGHTDVQEGEETTGVTLPLGLGSYNESDQLQISYDSRTQERTYSVSSRVNSSNATDVSRDLARSAGVRGGFTELEDATDQDNRRWSLSSSFSQAQIRQLKNSLNSGDFNYHRLIHRSGHGREFMQIVQGTEDLDVIATALAEFVSETGDDGLDLIRDTLNITPTYGIALAGDPHMTGESGHQAVAQKINEFTDMIDAPDSNTRGLVGTSINRELVRQRRRLIAISDTERYPELPPILRDMEINRTRDEIDTLQRLLQRATSLPRAQEQEEATQQEITSESDMECREEEIPTPNFDQQHTRLLA